MEVKILCACGTKFKFDVVPVNRRMPAPINCPGCGADATAEANAIIQANPVPEGQLLVAPAAPAATAPGLRIGRGAAPEPAANTAMPPPPSPLPPRPIMVPPKKAPRSPLVQYLILFVVLAAVGFSVWRFGSKWYRRISAIAEIASAAGKASVDSGESSGPKNLWYEKCAVLFIQHSNHLEVAEACKDFWKSQLHKNLAVLNESREYMDPGEYELIPAHNGYVRIVGAFEWPVPQQEGLARHLSKTFGSLAFEWRSESFADTYHFGVYDHGEQRFHAQMDIKMSGGEPQEVVTTEGNDFAVANGYKPGPEGFKEFHVLEADKITQKLGLNLGDEKEGQDVKTMLLKETGRK